MGSKDKKRRKRSLLIKQGCLCAVCKTIMPDDDVTIDHIVPRSKGGKNHLGNLQLTHFACNQRKGNKLWN